MSVVLVLEWLRDWNTNSFMPHGMCYMWQPVTLWSNVLGDAITAISYFLIPTGLIYFMRKRKDFDMPGILLAFAVFIISCGLVHAISVVNVWIPLYNTAGVLKGITAIASAGTLALMYIKMPEALSIPTPSELQKVNDELLQQIKEKEKLQIQLEEKATKLEETVRLLSATQEAANIGAWRADLIANQLFWSDQVYKIHGLENGKTLSIEEGINFYSDAYHEEVKTTVKNAIDDHGSWDKIWQLKQGDNEDKWVRSIGYTVVKNEKVVALEGLFMDVDTTMKSQIKLERYTGQLEEKNKELEAFSYSISHDLRAPLRSINGFADILVEDFSKILGDEGHRLLTIIKDNALKMGELIDDILQYSRLGRAEMNISNVDVQSLVHNIVRELKQAYDHPKIEVDINKLKPISGDHVLIKQMFQNLIDNAIKYSSKNEVIEIEIGCRQKAGKTQFFVKDNGAGFDEKYQDKIFGVFQRLHSSNEFKGTGVGLAIVKRIVEKHQGSIWAESSKGSGATFYITLGE